MRSEICTGTFKMRLVSTNNQLPNKTHKKTDTQDRRLRIPPSYYNTTATTTKYYYCYEYVYTKLAMCTLYHHGSITHGNHLVVFGLSYRQHHTVTRKIQRMKVVICISTARGRLSSDQAFCVSYHNTLTFGTNKKCYIPKKQ